MTDWREEIKKHYPDWYDGPPDPHLSVIHLRGADGEPLNQWRCTNCGKEGTYSELFMKAGCTYRHEPCRYCGCAPVCAKDCEGIGLALGDPKVYVAGFNPGKVH